MSDDEFERYVVMEPRRMVESSSDRDEAVSIASAWGYPCCVLDAFEFQVIYRNDARQVVRWWTVLGHYDEGDTFCQHVVAEDELSAAANAIELASPHCRDSLVIDCVLIGSRDTIVLSNNGKGVYAEDVLALKLGEEFNGSL